MTKHNYKLESTRSTTSGADRGLTQKRNNLISKLSSARVSTCLKITKTEFIGNYNIDKRDKETSIKAKGKFVSEQGWENLDEIAVKKFGSLEGYQKQYTKAEYFDLSNRQLKAATKQRPTAGLDDRQTSYITTDISKLL
tara:strand:+ start:2023 stop:2439 length:417 start_codon:yes stop_codon:yes gene_type:complete